MSRTLAKTIGVVIPYQTLPAYVDVDNGMVRNNHFHRNGNLAADAKQSYKHNVSQNNIFLWVISLSSEGL